MKQMERAERCVERGGRKKWETEGERGGERLRDRYKEDGGEREGERGRRK